LDTLIKIEHYIAMGILNCVMWVGVDFILYVFNVYYNEMLVYNHNAA